MGKWINRFKEKDSDSILNQGDKLDDAKNELTLSTMAPHTSQVTKKNVYIDISKINELKYLIKKISKYYGGDDEQFLEDYINDVINGWSHDLDAALACFRDLAI